MRPEVTDHGSSPYQGSPITRAQADHKQRVGKRRGSIWRILRCCSLVVSGLLPLCTTAWALAALFFDIRIPALRGFLLVSYVLTLAMIWMKIKRRFMAYGLSMACFGIVFLSWLLIPPSNARSWQPDVAILPFADIKGEQVSLHNIRYCKYRTESDFEVEHYDKILDLGSLKTVDLYLVYWGSSLIAHTMVSFGFAGGDYVCISIETRKEKGENYSAIRGFFRQFELIYVIADERDLVRLRTNFRKEDVYLYPIRVEPAEAQALFMEYLSEANKLCYQPKWYNALTDNCTTNIRVLSQRARKERTPLDWRVIANGYADQLLYESGRTDTSLEFAEFKKRSLVNGRALEASESNFSEQIRRGLPGSRQ
jgi:hypothetical protein